MTDAERLEEITEHHERALSAKDEGEARLRNKAIRARSWTVKGPDIKGEAMVLPTEDWDYLIDKGVELAVALAEVERLRGVAEVALAQVGTTCRRPTNITDTRGRVGHPCGEPAKCLPCALAALEAKP